jgi:homoserine kinase
MQQVTVSVPATSANLGPGFDCLGIALNLRQRVTFTVRQEPRIIFTAEGEDAHMIQRDEGNLVYLAMKLVFNQLGVDPPSGLHIHQDNEIPIASGLGSSSTAILAGLHGANELAGSPLTCNQVLQLATDFEGHPDNVAPATFGGLVLGVQTPDGLVVEQIPVPSMEVMVTLPDFELFTEAARAVLPTQVSLANVIYTSSRVGLLIRAFESADFNLFSVAMQDRIHQPYRVPIIPGMAEAMDAVLEAGAAGVALSGAGPSMIAFAADGFDRIKAAAALAFRKAGVNCRQWQLAVDNEGIRIQNKS